MPGETDLSSSAIRALLEAGEVQAAGYRLGRFYTLTGTVVHGFQNGRKLGFPTANLDLLSAEKVIPHRGSYATLAGMTETIPRHDQHWATAYLGQRQPSDDRNTPFGLRRRFVRTTARGSIRGTTARRTKIDNLNALKAQLNEDARQVRRYL